MIFDNDDDDDDDAPHATPKSSQKVSARACLDMSVLQASVAWRGAT